MNEPLPPLPPLPAICYPKRRRLVVAFFGMIVFVALGVFLYRHAEEYDEPGLVQLVAVACILFFGLGLVIIPFRLLRPQPLFELRRDGLMLRPDKPLIPWHSVREVQLVKIQHNTFVALVLVDPECYYERLKPSSRAMARLSANIAGTPLTLHASLAGIKPGVLAGWIETLRRAAGST